MKNEIETPALDQSCFPNRARAFCSLHRPGADTATRDVASEVCKGVREHG